MCSENEPGVIFFFFFSLYEKQIYPVYKQIESGPEIAYYFFKF